MQHQHILIFGTVYADDRNKSQLAQQWVSLHRMMNPGCDLMLVDSNSPMPLPVNVMIYDLGNNIGHLSREGKDGWGRAFCAGLQYAMDTEYDYVVHIEGDSLCRRSVIPVCQEMFWDDTFVCTVPVRGTRRPERNWVETGLMFFDVRKLNSRNFIELYDWNNGRAKCYPHTPEARIYDLLKDELEMLPWT